MGIARATYCCLFAVMLCVGVAVEAQPLGLVLSGGGARGAYEVGVWQELQTAGLALNVTAISGTSVGAINAALFAVKPSAAETIWLENMKDVFTLNTNRVGQTLQRTVDTASDAIRITEESGNDWKGVAYFLLSSLVQVASNAVDVTQTDTRVEGYVDSLRMADALDANLPSNWPKQAPSVYVTAVEKGSDNVSRTWRLNCEPHERRVLMVRASSAFPAAFDTVEIDGKPYVDGGWESKGGDNVPIGPILENHHEIKTVIVVFLKDEKNLSHWQRERVWSAAESKGVELVEIIPSEDIGGFFSVFDASPETARRLIALGRKDARNALRKAKLVE